MMEGGLPPYPPTGIYVSIIDTTLTGGLTTFEMRA